MPGLLRPDQMCTLTKCSRWPPSSSLALACHCRAAPADSWLPSCMIGRCACNSRPHCGLQPGRNPTSVSHDCCAEQQLVAPCWVHPSLPSRWPVPPGSPACTTSKAPSSAAPAEQQLLAASTDPDPQDIAFLKGAELLLEASKASDGVGRDDLLVTKSIGKVAPAAHVVSPACRLT